MKRSILLTGFGIIGGAALALALAGCNVDSADATIDIVPDSTSLRKNESVTLTARGGYNYTWSLTTESYGVLNTRSGRQVIYTSLYEPGSNSPVTQIVKVTSTFYNNSSSSNNASTNGTITIQSAEAYITHLPSDQPATTSTNGLTL